ncbi:hypothetical protein AVEN_177079-1 [Araneus ventricosus]|uniref:Uncharacterized protein n=1 Tax=Araneus ventricosus TaxID=182803 RepID=A0A4Y2CV14_ARAVE|nr:hypothetical protein AVEN_177079-1 [Araneus ventricosus]
MYCMIRSFEKRLESKLIRKFHKDLEIYKVIRHLIEEIDSQLSFLIFLSTLFNACTMYYGVNSLLRPDDFCSSTQQVSVWILFGTSYSSFIVMGVTGTLLHESSERVLGKTKELASNRESLIPHEKHILFNDNNQISLAVWKIVPIQRSFIIGTLGTVLTYCLLFNGMRTKAQNACKQ